MKKLKYSIKINAPKENVWAALWEDSNYREWTKAFSEGSHAVSDWKEGSKVLFLDGSGTGMWSSITKKVPNELMLFTHQGVARDGKEQPNDPETPKWAGATESYTLRESGGVTELKIEADVIEEYVDSFEKAYPASLEQIKQISEKSKAMSEV